MRTPLHPQHTVLPIPWSACWVVSQPHSRLLGMLPHCRMYRPKRSIAKRSAARGLPQRQVKDNAKLMYKKVWENKEYKHWGALVL